MMKTINDIVEITSGFAFRSKNFKDSSDAGYPIIRIQNLNGTTSEFKYWDLDYDEKYLVYENDILLSLSGNVKLDVWEGPTGLLNQRIIKINPKHGIIKDWLFYLLQSIVSDIENLSKKSIISNISVRDFKKINVKVPSVAKQKEIAEILNKAKEVKTKRQQQIEALSALKQSVYYGMLNSFKKEKFKLKDILKIDTVTMKDFTENPEYYLIGIDNIEKDTGRIINHKKITETSVKGSKHYFNEKHVLYSKIRPYLNKVATPTFEGVCSTDCYPLLVDETKATKEFVVLLLRSQEFVSYANSQSTGANIPRINQTKLLNYNFLMPNLEIQHRIKEKVNKIDQSILLMENSLEQINLLYDSILHKAFNGELFKEDINV